MGVQFVPLIAGPRPLQLPAREAVLDDLRHLMERRGEMIAAVDDERETILGTIGMYPGRDEGGTCFHLTGIEIEPGGAEKDIDVLLLQEAGRYLRAHRTTRLKFGTSPLLTRSAWLYVTTFGSRYRWRQGIRIQDGQHWPSVSGECDFEDPLARPLDLREDEVRDRSVLQWDSGRPKVRSLVYSGPLAVVLPSLDSRALTRARARDPGFIATLYAAFHALHIHGYGFAWFDRLPDTADPDPCWYYVMNRVVAF
jgi:hypothetical protein